MAGVERRVDDVDTKAVVAVKVEAFGDVAKIGQDLRLRREAFAPGSALLQLLVE